MDRHEFRSFWKAKTNSTGMEEDEEWHRRLADPKCQVLPDPETQEDTISILCRFGELATGKRKGDFMTLGLKNMKQPKEDKVNAIRSNLETRLGVAASVAPDAVGQALFKSDKILSRFDKGGDLMTEAAKKGSPAKRGKTSLAGLEVGSTALRVEWLVSKQRTAAEQTLLSSRTQALAAIQKTSSVVLAIDEAMQKGEKVHNATVYKSLLSTVRKRRDSLWIAFGRKAPAPAQPSDVDEEAAKPMDMSAEEGQSEIADCAATLTSKGEVGLCSCV